MEMHGGNEEGFSLSGAVCLVTGGATGLGRAVALRLGAQGARVVVNYSRSHEDAQKTVADIRSQGGEAVAERADVGRAHDVEDLVRRVVDRYERLDVLVSNAGTTVFKPFDDLDGISEDDWDRVMDVNVKATWRLAKAAGPVMKRQGAGRIVTISSVAGLKPQGSSLAYSVSKAALIHLTRGLAVALAPEVLVNSVAPGLLETRWISGHSKSTIERFIADSPLRRTPTVADCAQQVMTFVQSASITGTVAVVDAGSSL